MEILADATNVIAEGEVLQLMNMHDADAGRDGLPARDPLQDRQAVRGQRPAGRRARRRAAARSRKPAPTTASALGTAFQLIDDVLDYAGDAAEIGKNLGDDLREGKPTLPLIFAMQRGTPEERALIRHAIEQGEVERLAEIVQIVRRTGALDATREAARREADHAREQLAALPDSEAKHAAAGAVPAVGGTLVLTHPRGDASCRGRPKMCENA